MYLVFSRGLTEQVVSEGVSHAVTVQETRSSGRGIAKALRQEHVCFDHDKKKEGWCGWSEEITEEHVRRLLSHLPVMIQPW